MIPSQAWESSFFHVNPRQRGICRSCYREKHFSPGSNETRSFDGTLLNDDANTLQQQNTKLNEDKSYWIQAEMYTQETTGEESEHGLRTTSNHFKVESVLQMHCLKTCKSMAST